jgi:hypothetical protein
LAKKQRIEKQRLSSNELTPAQLDYLTRGRSYFDNWPFKSEEDARRCWFENRDFILSLRDVPHQELNGAYFDSGTRPWAFWFFEHPEILHTYQYRTLERMGLLDEQEKRTALYVAKEQWKTGYALECRPEVSDEQLLDAWPLRPNVPAVWPSERRVNQ